MGTQFCVNSSVYIKPEHILKLKFSVSLGFGKLAYGYICDILRAVSGEATSLF